jgi:hypothetical protein
MLPCLVVEKTNTVHRCALFWGFLLRLIMHGKGKGKAIPLKALTGPKGSRRLRLPDF